MPSLSSPSFLSPFECAPFCARRHNDPTLTPPSFNSSKCQCSRTPASRWARDRPGTPTSSQRPHRQISFDESSEPKTSCEHNTERNDPFPDRFPGYLSVQASNNAGFRIYTYLHIFSSSEEVFLTSSPLFKFNSIFCYLQLW